jgi:hypothetical protein
MHVEDIEPKPELKSQALCRGVNKFEDQDHIASVIEYQYTQNIWAIFLTFDEKDLLNNAERLRECCALYVTKPIYANDYKREMSKMTRPVDFYQQQKTLAPCQKQFADVLSNALNIKISNV